MSAQRLREELEAMASQEGLCGCALVDLETGLVLHWAGPPEQQPVAEAATDYWRLCNRQQAVFGMLGAPLAQVLIHAHTRVTIVRCGEGLLLVTLSQEAVAVDWARWKRATAHLQQVATTL